jgi:ABC-type transporter lipoprotein component MlaA
MPRRPSSYRQRRRARCASVRRPTPKADPNAITVEAKRRPSPTDPFENINEKSYEVVQGVDKAFVAPVASVYRDGLPGRSAMACTTCFTTWTNRSRS